MVLIIFTIVTINMKSIITYTFLIILLSGCLTSTATNSEPSKDLNPKITNQLIEATISKNTVITLGPLIGNGNEAISYTISASDH